VAPKRASTGGAPIVRPAVLESLPDFQGAVGACAAREGLEPERAANLALAVEEVFVNICRYAYPDGAGEATLVCAASADDFTVEITDDGRAFDPSELPEPNLSEDLDARPVGGLGWYLVRRMVDDLQYHRDDDRNVVQLIMHRRRGGPP
jgi:anti-sigma regulatory factor (Ser/Thr protein kinase)